VVKMPSSEAAKVQEILRRHGMRYAKDPVSFVDLWREIEKSPAMSAQVKERAYDALETAYRSSGVLAEVRRTRRGSETDMLILFSRDGTRGEVVLANRQEKLAKSHPLLVEDVIAAAQRAREVGGNILKLLGDSTMRVVRATGRVVRLSANEFWHAAIKAAGTATGVSAFAILAAALCLFLSSLGLAIPPELVHQAQEILKLLGMH
jgi:hypothetical protein